MHIEKLMNVSYCLSNIVTLKNGNWCALSVCALDSDLPHWGTWANLKLAPLLLVPSCVVNELLVVARGHTCVPTLHNNIRGMTQFDFTLELFSCKCPFTYICSEVTDFTNPKSLWLVYPIAIELSYWLSCGQIRFTTYKN